MRRVLLIATVDAACGLSAGGAGRPARASPAALRALRDLALVSDQLHALQGAVRPAAESGLLPPAELASLSGVFDEGAAGLADSLGALRDALSAGAADVAAADVGAAADAGDAVAAATAAAVAAPAEGAAELRVRASKLHDRVEKQRRLVLLLEEQESGQSSRCRATFDHIDADADGALSLAEFEGAAAALLTIGKGAVGDDTSLRQTMLARFADADADGSGTLDFGEFQTLVKSLRGDTLAPLRSSLGGSLHELLEVTLQMTAVTLASELTLEGEGARGARPARRSEELGACVERWCAIEARASALPPSADDAIGASESLLLEIGCLAESLSLTNVTSSYQWSAVQAYRQAGLALNSLRASLAFCWRGLTILGRDVLQVARSLNGQRTGAPMAPSDWALARRTAVDIAMLVPYSIIMIIPLSPPGHVFAVSLLNRCFPGAVPSQFTAQRQDVYEIYDRIAIEARSEGADADRVPRGAPQGAAQGGGPADALLGGATRGGKTTRLRAALRGLRERVAAVRAPRGGTA